MKYVIFLGDGMGDEAQESLGGLTILEKAETPHMDMIAREGACGLLKTVPDGLPPDSTVANLSVMGYDPRKCLEGRGVLEAAAMGVDIGAGDHAMRMNLISVTDGRIRTHSGGNISTPEAAELVQALREQLKFDGIEYHTGVSYRHVLKLTRPASKAIKCDPPHDYLDEPMEEHLPVATSAEGEETAALLRELVLKSNGVLENHPVNSAREKRGEQKANYCWPWSIGTRPKMETFKEMFGKTGAIVSAVDLIRGIGVYAGMDTIIVPGATGLWDTNYEGKADAALELLKNHDLVYIHVEGPDEAGHEGNLEVKIRAIEALDKRLMARVMNSLPEPVRFAVLPDHYTPIKVRTHVGAPVPFAMMGDGISPDRVKSYSERTCAEGFFGLLTGSEFMKNFLKDS